MTAPNHRHERIGEEIAHEINAMLAGELKDPRLEISVVVNEVRLAPDGRNARVFIGARGTEEEQKGAIKALEHAVALSATRSSSVCSCAAYPTCISRSTTPKSTRPESTNFSKR